MSSILEAADRILRTDGYEAASTNRVARVAGFSVGSLYQYFRDKQGIVGALIDGELAAEAELLHQAFERTVGRGANEIVSAVFGELLARRLARAHLHRTLDVYASELGAPSVLHHLVAAGSARLADTIQRTAARTFPRSVRSVDGRVFVMARLALSASFAMAVDAPPGLSSEVLRDAFAAAVDRYLDGSAPGPNATSLALRWAKPVTAPASLAEQRARARREARGALVSAGVGMDRLESLVVLLAGLADVARATARPPRGTNQEDLVNEVARFIEAIGA